MKAVKFYYTKPIELVTIAFNPTNALIYQTPVKPTIRYTFVAIYDNDAKEIRFGYAKCNPKDNFCKATGRSIAVNRAESNPIHVIKNFRGYRNEFADEVMGVFKFLEKKFLKRLYPNFFNPDNIVDC